MLSSVAQKYKQPYQWKATSVLGTRSTVDVVLLFTLLRWCVTEVVIIYFTYYFNYFTKN